MTRSRLALALLPALAATTGMAAPLTLDFGSDWRSAGLISPQAAGFSLHESLPYEHLAEPTVAGTAGFDAWRLTVRYTLIDAEQGSFGLGLTTRGQELFASDPTALPSAPLVHAFGEFRFLKNWRIAGSLDAAGVRPGRDLGLGLQLSYDLSHAWSVAAGYRLQDQRPLDDSNPALNSNWFTVGTRFRF